MTPRGIRTRLSSPTYLELDNERRTLRDHHRILITNDIDENTAEGVIEDLSVIKVKRGKGKTIWITISSGGGDVFAGLAIIHAIKEMQQSGWKVVGRVYGHAQSMAFLIFQVCDCRVMGSLDILMCHGATHESFGDVKDLEAQQLLMSKFRDDFANLLAERATVGDNAEEKETAFWIAILESNTPQYYNAKQAYKMGLIDEVV